MCNSGMHGRCKHAVRKRKTKNKTTTTTTTKNARESLKATSALQFKRAMKLLSFNSSKALHFTVRY